jgi:basic membrane protein A
VLLIERTVDDAILHQTSPNPCNELFLLSKRSIPISHLRLIIALCIVLTLIVGVGATSAQDSDLRMALIIAQGGLGDRSYNDSAFAGLTLAAQEFGVEVVPIESSDPVGEGEQLLRTAAESGFDLVITLEFSHFDPLARVVPDYPDTLFSIVNIVVDQHNIVSVMCDEHTGSYLAGTLAALVTTDADIPNTNEDAAIGVIGGVAAYALHGGWATRSRCSPRRPGYSSARRIFPLRRDSPPGR